VVCLRLDLNEIISDLLMEACVSSALMQEGLLREHIMLIAVLNSLIGSEVGKYSFIVYSTFTCCICIPVIFKYSTYMQFFVNIPGIAQ
jgi:hypothetical protein